MAPEYGGSAGPDASTVPLADGGAEDRAAQGKQSSERPERDLIPESIKNAGFLTCFMVSDHAQAAHCFVCLGLLRLQPLHQPAVLLRC